ncbi:MAG: Nramp family divalent metal transporter [Acidobacteriota bacterium]
MRPPLSTKRLLGVLAGAVVAAAFLGPGTVTTAARAGSAHGPRLLWALLFATVACWVLQDAAARLTLASGHPLGEALRRRFRSGASAVAVLWLVVGAVVVGCAAYEAGNILGGVAGAQLALPASKTVLTLVSGGAALALLWFGSTGAVVGVLGMLVAVMGLGFLATAVGLVPAPAEVARGLLVPSVPEGGALLVLGLVGTTVVPYNLFLGSGLARGQDPGEARLGLAVAIGLGGLISMAVVVVGGAVVGDFSFGAVAEVLGNRLGGWAVGAFGLGLFAAGFSSAVTAPLAAAITARGLFAEGADDPRWHARGWRFRVVWLGVLGAGVTFGLLDVRPVPVILLAQALNGILLPVVAVFLMVVVNDRRLMGGAVNGPAANLLMGLVVAVTTALGARGVLRAAASTFDRPALASAQTLWIATAASLLVLGVWLVRELRGR